MFLYVYIYPNITYITNNVSDKDSRINNNLNLTKKKKKIENRLTYE